MADLREVFEMVKQQTEPDLDSWAEQERRMHRATQKRKIGAYALVAAIAVAAFVFVLNSANDDPDSIPAAESESVNPAPLREFVLLDIDTGTITGTGIVPGASGVDVSPDGTEIVYAGDSGGGLSVHVANIDGSNVRAFDQTASPGGPAAPRWSPDGTTVVYQGVGNGNKIGNLYVLDTTTGRVTQITDLEPLSAGFYYMAPTFSPDGDTVLFTRPTGSMSGGGDGGRSWDLWSVPVTGGEPTLMQRNAIGGDFSPSGGAIAYSAYSEVDGQFEFGDLYVARSDGSGARKLVDGSTMLPRWSPDGSQIGYTDVERGGLFVVDVETGETKRILDSDEWATWIDENTMIVDLSD
jgi:Tol biopolymer transport system component